MRESPHTAANTQHIQRKNETKQEKKKWKKKKEDRLMPKRLRIEGWEARVYNYKEETA